MCFSCCHVKSQTSVRSPLPTWLQPVSESVGSLHLTQFERVTKHMFPECLEEEENGDDDDDDGGFQCPVSEDPYSMLGCDCQKNVPGKTGVILGPLWCVAYIIVFFFFFCFFFCIPRLMEIVHVFFRRQIAQATVFSQWQ